MKGAHADACLAEQDFGDANDVPMQWDKNHNFTQLHQEHAEPSNAHNTEKRCKRTL